MTYFAQPRRATAGFAIVAAAVVMLVLMAMAAALTDLTVGSVRQAGYRKDDANLTVSAESVANLGFNYLQNLPTLSSELVAIQSRPASDPADDLTTRVRDAAALYAGHATLNGVDERVTWKWLGKLSVPILGQSSTQDIYQMTATAAAGGPARYYNSNGTTNAIDQVERYRRRRVEAVFTKFPSNIYKQAMFARKGYDFMGSATTDSWNSNGGQVAYSGAATGQHGDLSSNGDIVVQKAGAVQGAVKSNISMPVPPMTYSPPATATIVPGPTLGVFSKTTSSLTTGSYHCSSVDLSKDNSIQIADGAQVDLYVDGPLIIDQSWTIPATATVRIFQNNYDPALGTTTMNGNITVGSLQNPAALQIYSLYDGTLGGNSSSPVAFDIKMNGTASFSGVMFCPYATFKLNGNFDYYGSLLANSFFDNSDSGKVNGNFHFHYDESLGNLSLPFPPTLVVVGWRAYNLGLAQYKSPGVMWDDP